jgi:hypothetical protein
LRPNDIGSNREIYRRFQVLNAAANENYRDWVCTAYSGVTLASISVAFCLIKFRVQWNLIQIGLFLIILAALLPLSAICIQQAIQLSLHSKAIITSLGKTDTSNGKIGSRFWKSCTTIEIWVGNFFTFTTPAFLLHIYGKIIFESVITIEN